MGLVDAASLSDWEVVGRLGAATALGALIGLEREIDGQDAGMRTHALLALGSGLFGVISVGGFGDFITSRAATNVQVDVTRVASYVAAGVGFLGGGAILKQAHRVRGLTTAASLWACSAVGLAAGIGFYSAAIAASVATVIMLLLDAPMRRLRRRKERHTLTLTLASTTDHRALVTSLLDAGVGKVTVGTPTEGPTTITVAGLSRKQARALMQRGVADHDVIETSIT